MMSITAGLVKELRERTGAPMMDCKKALVAADGDIDAAAEAMRKAGAAKADKKAGRIAAEGTIAMASSDDNKSASMIEVNSETDFVARDENFMGFALQLAARALTEQCNDVDALNQLTFDDGGKAIEETRQDLVAKLGENLKVRRVVFLNSEGCVATYQHGQKIGVMVQLNVDNVELGKDIAMHIAASAPQAINPDDVSKELVDKEREIFSAQAEASGKPPEIIEKMIDGRINKFLSEVCLLGQPFVKDPSKTVGTLLKGENAKVLSFQRFEVGEGIEKAEDNFAEEVMAQVRGAE